jgi:hypothetical protein
MSWRIRRQRRKVRLVVKKQSAAMHCGYSVVLERVASAGILPRKQTARSVAGSGGRKECGETSQLCRTPDRVHGEFSSATICEPRSGNPRNTLTFASWMFPPYTGSIKSGKNLLQCCRTYTVELHAYVAANTNTWLTSLEAELELSQAVPRHGRPDAEHSARMAKAMSTVDTSV